MKDVVFGIFTAIMITGCGNSSPQGPRTEVEPRLAQIMAEGSDIFSIRDNDVTRGSGDILLIEYSDFECGFSERFYPTAQTLVDEGAVTWVYRHFPLPYHQTADEAAKIADCVRIHGGNKSFWQFTDIVFASGSVDAADPVAAYRKIGAGIGLTDGQIDRCLAPGSESSQVISQHWVDAQVLNISGVPESFLVDTRTGVVVRIPGAFPLGGSNGGPNVRDLLRMVQ